MNGWIRLDGYKRPGNGVVVAIGTFDGVHVAHQSILKEAIRRAEELDAVPIALTFDRHPSSVVSPKGAPPCLHTAEERFARIREVGVAECVVAKFDAAFAAMLAERFASEVLIERLGAVGVVVGFDFTFGRGREGDARWLREHGDALGIKVWSVSPVKMAGEAVSSTRIRRLLSEGRVVLAAELLGRPFSTRGLVVTGDQIGRSLGYPTANLQPAPGCMLPADGIYAGWATVLGDDSSCEGRVPCAISVGPRPTFGRMERRVEAFLLDFEGELYGRTLDIAFVERLRDVEAFDTPDALKEQMGRDVEMTRRVLNVSAAPDALATEGE